MNLDPVLLEILVCPDCKGSLTVDEDNNELICNGCGLIYPVRDDIPVMLVDEARRADEPAGAAAAAAGAPAAAEEDADEVVSDVAETAGDTTAGGGEVSTAAPDTDEAGDA